MRLVGLFEGVKVVGVLRAGKGEAGAAVAAPARRARILAGVARGGSAVVVALARGLGEWGWAGGIGLG